MGRRGLAMVAAFWVGIPVKVTQEAGVVPRCRRAAIGTPLLPAHTTRREKVSEFYPPPTRRGVRGLIITLTNC